MSAPMPEQATHELARRNAAFLRQGAALIRGLRDEDYCGRTPHTPRGGVGVHFRHVLDHYECFASGLASGRVDYDRRERDEALENSRLRATSKIEAVLGLLESIDRESARQALVVVADCGETGERVATDSNVARELQFLVSHTVHHFAVIALILRERGIEPGADFGVAPSTLKFEQGRSVCAR